MDNVVNKLSEYIIFSCLTFCNMSVVKATLIFSIATYLDVILNPLMGFITDSFYRTKLGRKFGRRRFFILTGIPLMLLHRNAWQGFTTAILLYRW